MIIDKEENLDLNSTSYKNHDIKALSRKLVYSKNTSAEPIGFFCFLIPILVSIIFYIIEIIFSITIPSKVTLIITLLLSPLVLGYIFMKSIQVINKNKVTTKYIFNTNVFLIFLVAIILFAGVIYFLYRPISHMIMVLLGSQSMLDGIPSALNNPRSLIHFSVSFILLLVIRELAKALILYILEIILFLIIFNIFAFPAYICASKKVTLLEGLKEGLKLSFKNIFKLLKIEFSFIHIIFFTIWIQPLFIWKGLYIFTSISLVIEKSLQINSNIS
ncbi:MAG: hypothetical protein ACRDAU_06870 [Clostridium sp.]